MFSCIYSVCNYKIHNLQNGILLNINTRVKYYHLAVNSILKYLNIICLLFYLLKIILINFIDKKNCFRPK